MTLFLTLLLVLWGLPQARAEDPFNRADNESIIDLAPSHLVMTAKDLEALAKEMKQDYGAQLRVQLIDPPCLATMEAAMRAMEPFIHDGIAGPDLRGNDRFHMELWPKHAIEAFKQWELAKACWQKETP